LNEKDDHFTLDVNEVLQKSWRRDRVSRAILERFRREQYSYVIVLLPTEETHGAHKAASILTLEAVSQLNADARPVVLGALQVSKRPDLWKHRRFSGAPGNVSPVRSTSIVRQ
jgi:hypothetical protein